MTHIEVVVGAILDVDVVTVPGGLRQMTYPTMDGIFVHCWFRLGLYAMSWAVVSFLDAAKVSHVSPGITTYVLHFCGMQRLVPVPGKSLQNAASLLARTR
jgi:hypothetical protein